MVVPKNPAKIGDEYGCSTKNLGIYKNKYYFDRSGVGSLMTYEHNNWSRWMTNSSHGFTKYGIEKISESARAYSYLILTSQAFARHGILGDTAPALAAQRIFYDNLKDVIEKAVSLKNDIERYQRSLKYARSALDYSIGKGLYMLPSDMLFKPLNQVIEGYNDMIAINTSGLELGRRVENPTASTEQHKLRKRPHTLNDHNDEVTSIIIAIGTLTLFAVWWVK